MQRGSALADRLLVTAEPRQPRSLVDRGAQLSQRFGGDEDSVREDAFAICWKRIREHQRAPLLQSRLMGVHGVWQREGEVVNLIAGRIEDLTPLLGRLADSTASRNFH